MKNQREVCYAKNAGFVQFSGLPGAVKTGCVASPAFMSRYCPQHKPQACTLLNVDGVDEDLGNLQALHCDPVSPNNTLGNQLLRCF